MSNKFQFIAFCLFFLLHLVPFNFNFFPLLLPQYLSNYFLSIISVSFVLEVWNISLFIHCFISCVWPLCYIFSLFMLSQFCSRFTFFSSFLDLFYSSLCSCHITFVIFVVVAWHLKIFLMVKPLKLMLLNHFMQILLQAHECLILCFDIELNVVS